MNTIKAHLPMNFSAADFDLLANLPMPEPAPAMVVIDMIAKKEVEDLTDEDKLALYIAAGLPIRSAIRVGENHAIICTTTSLYPFAIAKQDGRFVVAVRKVDQ